MPETETLPTEATVAPDVPLRPAIHLDHCVIHVSDWQWSNSFYIEVLGAELVQRPVGWAYRFGDKQLNVHGPGVQPAEVARLAPPAPAGPRRTGR